MTDVDDAPRFGVPAGNVLTLATAILAAVRRNDSNLTDAGLAQAVAARIGTFLANHFGHDGSAGGRRFSVRRPTKPGWYWLKQYGAVKMVEVTPSLQVAGVGDVLTIAGGKWCGPLEAPS